MDDARGARGHLHAHRGVDRNDQLIVHSKKTRLVWLFGLNIARFGLAQNIGVEGDALIHIFIVPVPLLAGRLDGQRRLGDVHLAEREDVGA
ncbi:hypothetical protein D9M68_931240 [compost metagenome]